MYGRISKKQKGAKNLEPLVDYKKIKLADERSSHVEKRLNRLGVWKFFKVLYRDSMLKIFLLNFLLLIFAVPAILVYYFKIFQETYALNLTLPTANFLGIGSNVWLNVGAYSAEQTQLITNGGIIWLSLSLLALAFVFSGGFAVIRDAFWTGKLVVLKPFWKGITASIGYTFAGTAVLSGSFLGIYFLSGIIKAAFPTWAYIVMLVVIWAVFVLLFMYIYTLFAVAVTYRQPVGDNLADAWRLMWLNFLPNLIRIIITAVPFVLYFLFASSGGILTTLLLAAALMFGMFYLVFVYMTHMMKTFALFHPVEKKK